TQPAPRPLRLDLRYSLPACHTLLQFLVSTSCIGLSQHRRTGITSPISALGQAEPLNGASRIAAHSSAGTYDLASRATRYISFNAFRLIAVRAESLHPPLRRSSCSNSARKRPSRCTPLSARRKTCFRSTGFPRFEM